MRALELVHLYHASMGEGDRGLITQVRDQEVERDFNSVDWGSMGEKKRGDTEWARFQYYDGRNPDWPEQVLTAELAAAQATFQEMVQDERTHLEIITTNRLPSHPVLTKALTQVTMGAPQSVYNGGLLRATVRYFDCGPVCPGNPRLGTPRPGLPRDVAALVDELGPDSVGLQLVNAHPGEGRRLTVQAGAFGEHAFTDVVARLDRDQGTGDAVRVDGRYFTVDLPPGTTIRLRAGLRRFCNDPTYAFPWHANGIPVPFPQPG